MKEIGTGKSMVDPLTGQTFQLFTADEATRNNHAMFAQYAKADPNVQREMDLVMNKAYKPKDGQTLGGSLTGSDMALNDGARDYANMKNQPAVVQWAVLGEIRQTRGEVQGEHAQLTKQLGDPSLTAEQRGQTIAQLTTLEARDQALRDAARYQILDMSAAGNISPAQQREWTEGFGSALGAARLGTGMRAPIGERVNVLRGAIDEVKAVTAAEAAAARTRVDVNARTDDAQQYVNVPAAKDPYAVPESVTRRDNDFNSPVNHRGDPKAAFDENGNLVAPNPSGAGDIKDQVRGGNSGRSPYISATDPASATNPRNYGANEIEIRTRELQRDINNGQVTGTEVVSPEQVQAALRQRINERQDAYNNSPTLDNRQRLDRARGDLQNATGDGECLIKGCVPAPYIVQPPTPPRGTVAPRQSLTLPPVNSRPPAQTDEEKKEGK